MIRMLIRMLNVCGMGNLGAFFMNGTVQLMLSSFLKTWVTPERNGWLLGSNSALTAVFYNVKELFSLIFLGYKMLARFKL